MGKYGWRQGWRHSLRGFALFSTLRCRHFSVGPSRFTGLYDLFRKGVNLGTEHVDGRSEAESLGAEVTKILEGGQRDRNGLGSFGLRKRNTGEQAL